MRKQTKELLLGFVVYVGVGAVIGAIAGLELSFTALSPLIIGRILGSFLPTLFIVILLGKLLYNFFTWKENSGQYKEDLILGSFFSLVGAVVGGMIVTSYFPGAVVMGSTALAGAVIVVVSPLIVAIALGICSGFPLKREVLAGAVIGASTVFALSFSVALSPLIVGGIVGALSGTLFGGSNMPWERQSTQEKINFCFSMYSLGAVSGAGLGASANAIFPGIMLSIAPAILAGAVIGAIAPFLGLFTYGKVNEYIISPVVEKVTECFSSKESRPDVPCWRN